MYRPVPLILIASILALFIGWGGGGYLAWSRASATLAALPAAPVVTAAEYDREARVLAVTLTNPGLVPIELVSKTLVLRPAEGGKDVALLDVAFSGGSLTLPPASLERLELALEPGDPKLSVGDVLAASIAYRYPEIADLYLLTHSFVAGSEDAPEKDGADGADASKDETPTVGGNDAGEETR